MSKQIIRTGEIEPAEPQLVRVYHAVILVALVTGMSCLRHSPLTSDWSLG